MFPEGVICSVPGRHVVLGLCLAELANSAGLPFSVNIPAAHLPRPWPTVVRLWVLNGKGGNKDEPRRLQEDNTDVYDKNRHHRLTVPLSGIRNTLKVMVFK